MSYPYDFLEFAKKTSTTNEVALTYATIAIAEELRAIHKIMEVPGPIEHVGHEIGVRADLLHYHQEGSNCKCLINSACPEHGEGADGPFDTGPPYGPAIVDDQERAGLETFEEVES